jgi:hypothetical protein
VRHRHVTLLLLAALALGLAGVGFSDVVAGEHVACTPTHTIADNGNPLGEIPGECVTATDQTVTETVTTTETVTVTAPPPPPPPPPPAFTTCGGQYGQPVCASGAYFVRTMDSPETLIPPTYWDFNALTAGATVSLTADPTDVGNPVFLSHVADSPSYADYASIWQNEAMTHAGQGEETWYSFRFYLPPGFKACGYRQGQPNCEFNWIHQPAHENSGTPGQQTCTAEDTGSLSLGILDSNLYSTLRLRAQIYAGQQATSNCQGSVGDEDLDAATPIVTGHWYDVVEHIRWNGDGSKGNSPGLYELYLDGARVISQVTPTLYKHPNGSYEFARSFYGYYRSSGDAFAVKTTWPADVYYDDVREGPSSVSVGFTP